MIGSICLRIIRDPKTNAQVISQTIQINQKITEGKFLCSFLNAPPFQRVVDISEISTWLIFPDQISADKWVAASRQQEMPIEPPTPPEVTPPGKPTPGGNSEVKPGDEVKASEAEKPEDATEDEPFAASPAEPPVTKEAIEEEEDLGDIRDGQEPFGQNRDDDYGDKK